MKRWKFNTYKQTVKSLSALTIMGMLSACGGSSGSDNDDTTANVTPVASAGTDQTAAEQSSVTLQGSGTDSDGTIASYNWTQTSGTSVTLTSSNSASSSFTAPDISSDETLTFELTVTDNDGATSTDTINIAILAASETGNTTPIANAGDDQSVSTGNTVTLSASQSLDADGDDLTYLWSLTSTPTNSSASLSSTTSASPTFTADITGSYVVSLVVNDGLVDSDTDTVAITASESSGDITNIIFTNQSGNCEDYVGSYFSDVTDIQRGLDFAGDVVISSDGSKCTFAVNEIPNHDFNDATASFATNASEQNSSYQVDASPVAAASVTTLNLGVTNVITLNGVVVDILAAACYDVGNEPLGQEKIGCGQDQIDNPWRYDPMSPLNNFGTDIHNAHTQPSGTYHYHGDPQAMYNTDCDITAEVSPVIGFAADGFPLYGPCIDDNGSVRRAASSYTLKDNGGARQDVTGYTTPADGVGGIASGNYDGQFRGDYEYSQGAGDLDECNGMTVNGQYGYYVTNEYPWVLACFTGTPDESLQRIGRDLQNTLHSHN